jgi:hypothetical protein
VPNTNKTTKRCTHVVGINNKKLMDLLDIMMKQIRFGENKTLHHKNNVRTNGIYTELWFRVWYIRMLATITSKTYDNK